MSIATQIGGVEMYGPGRGDPPGYVHHDVWWGFFHLVPFLLFLVLIGVGIWAVLRITSRPVAGAGFGAGAIATPVRDAAVEELRIRYARGDLGRDDFAQRMRDLGHPDIGPPGAASSDVPSAAESDPPAGGG
jgi:hypothetical protein